jgi:hypothetical protein
MERWDNLQVEVRGSLIIVSLPGTPSYAIYTKPGGQPQVVLVSSDTGGSPAPR